MKHIRKSAALSFQKQSLKKINFIIAGGEKVKAKIENSQNTKEIIKKLFKYIRPYRRYLITALILSVITVAFTLLAPILMGNGIDLIISKGNVNFQKLKSIIVLIILVIAITAIAQWLMNLCTNKLTYNTVRDIRLDAFAKLEKVPVSYVDNSSQGDLISRIVTDIDLVSDGLLMGFTQLFSGVITILATIGFMISINLKIALIVIIITPLSFFVASFVAKRTFNMFQAQSIKRGEMTSHINEMITGQKIVKAYNYENESTKRFEKINSELETVGVKALFFSAITNPATRFINGLVYSGVGIFGAISAIGGYISVGQLSAFLTYANQYTKPFNEISSVITELQSAFASAKRVFEIIEADEEQSDDGLHTLEKVDGTLSLKDVSFSYTPDRPLIENLNLDVRRGERIAIVGPTGCGKTTLINLLMRFYDVTDGNIKISEKNIKEITRHSLRHSFGMVLQETWLSKGTIKENIAFGKPNASDEEIITAAKNAHAHSFIQRLPKGYDTVVSDDSENLSSGQKQLLCIARVMLTLPPMLILDEATSNIDTRTEKQIQAAFEKMLKGRTSFIVAHRLSTIKNADCILVMNNGNIVEQGNHNELLSKNGFYSKLYNSQFEKS